MRFVLLIACSVLIFTFLTSRADAAGNKKAESDTIDYETDFVMSASGSYSSPKNIFQDNYNASPGFMFGAGVAFSQKSDCIPGAFTFLFVYSRDYFEISELAQTEYSIDKDPEATISAIQLRVYSDSAHVFFKGVGIHPVFGGGVGGAIFSMTDENFDKMGHNTLTELKHENNKTQLSSFSELGVKVSGLGPASLHYSYQLFEVQRTWKPLHSFLSSSIKGFTVIGIPRQFDKLVGEDVRASRKYHLAKMLYQAGMNVLWYQVTYDQNNWPFNDEAPLHFHRQLVSLEFQF